MLRAFGIIFGAGAIGGLLGWGVYETVQTVRSSRKMKQEYPDLKLMDRLRIAAKERVEKIKATPRYIYENVMFIASSAFMAAYGYILGNINGIKEGRYIGIGEGADKLVQALYDKCPKEFKKFIEILLKKGVNSVTFYDETRKTCKGKVSRGYSWEPENYTLKLLKNKVSEAIS